MIFGRLAGSLIHFDLSGKNSLDFSPLIRWSMVMSPIIMLLDFTHFVHRVMVIAAV